MIFAWLGALFIGISLGLLGSGGSILTVPVLVYLVGQPEKIAIAGSLAIVGTISLFSAIPYALKKQIVWRSVLLFGAPGIVGAIMGAAAARYVSAPVQMMIFAALMLSAAWLMYRPMKLDADEEHTPRASWKIMIDGLVVGAITGIVGVGGGFLIIPALVLLGGLSMRMAVGTSLVIITLKSFAGFFEYLHVLHDLNLSIDWAIVGIFSIIGVFGGFLGNAISNKLPQTTLRKAFAVFLLLMGAFIFYKNLPRLLGDTQHNIQPQAEQTAPQTH
ncbi:MAG: sulfite exporter TauE/SafE family protein [Gammaproteobacteria bacterium]|nr:MAG: sulfite exporter TauE/SafE family protein [Gammaproteobacteria bacterium]